MTDFSEDGKEALCQWMKAAYPGLKPDEHDPLSYPLVCFTLCRPDGRIVERVELLNATISEVKPDGTIVWDFERFRIRPWWRAVYRWWRRLIGKPIAGPGEQT